MDRHSIGCLSFDFNDDAERIFATLIERRCVWDVERVDQGILSVVCICQKVRVQSHYDVPKIRSKMLQKYGKWTEKLRATSWFKMYRRVYFAVSATLVELTLSWVTDGSNLSISCLSTHGVTLDGSKPMWKEDRAVKNFSIWKKWVAQTCSVTWLRIER